MVISRPGFVRLLEVDPSLAVRVPKESRDEARHRLILRTRALSAGPWSLEDEDRGTHPLGVILLRGLVLREVDIAGRRCLQALGPGDVVLPQAPVSESLEIQTSWTATAGTEVALLDDRLQIPLALWPGIAVALMERVGRQLARLAVQKAISQLPRVEDRLEAAFWDLADLWGRVTPSGIHLPLRLTHETLARLVGARRPTISLALTVLADRGIVSQQRDGWMITASRPSAAVNFPPNLVAVDAPAPLVAEPPLPDAGDEPASVPLAV